MVCLSCRLAFLVHTWDILQNNSTLMSCQIGSPAAAKGFYLFVLLVACNQTKGSSGE